MPTCAGSKLLYEQSVTRQPTAEKTICFLFMACACWVRDHTMITWFVFLSVDRNYYWYKAKTSGSSGWISFPFPNLLSWMKLNLLQVIKNIILIPRENQGFRAEEMLTPFCETVCPNDGVRLLISTAWAHGLMWSPPLFLCCAVSFGLLPESPCCPERKLISPGSSVHSLSATSCRAGLSEGEQRGSRA